MNDPFLKIILIKTQITGTTTLILRMIMTKPASALTLFLALLLTGFTGCEKPTEPKAETPKADTTSHNFVWDVDTIGYRNTTLSDGVIINENDMWVAGEIYPDSSSYHNATHYGLAHWEGKKWTPEIVMARTDVENPEIKEASIIRGMAVVDENEIFISTGFLLMKRDNIRWVEKAQDIIDKKAFSKIWGSNSNNLYIYGANGGLYHYNGTSLTSIPTNTSLDIMDINGDWNPKTGEYELLALASTPSELKSSEILKITNKTVELVSTKGLNEYSKWDIWFEGNLGYWVAGFNGTYFKKALTDSSWVKKTDYPNSWRTTSAIGGNSEKDMFLLQSGGHVLHFNGSSWKDFRLESNVFAVSDFYYEVIVKGDLVLIFGSENTDPNRVFVIRGMRIN
ncbi:MAG: hypothetical protein L6Q77_14745 [Bacteroidetes bacterium]|nr:hypothetical protein [Bacteroidota bacterium]